MFYPHSATYQNSAVEWDGNVYNGVEFGPSTAFSCHITPLKSIEILNRFNREQDKGFLLIAPIDTGIDDYALVTWNGNVYKATGLNRHQNGLPTDHIEMMLELCRG